MRRRLMRIMVIGNVLILAFGLAVAGVQIAGRAQDGGQEQAADTLGPGPPDVDPLLPITGDADRPPVDPAARRVDLPGHELDYLPPGVRSGVLGGDPALDGGCAWIEMDGERHAVRWPGFEAAFIAHGGGGETLELVDDAGGVVAAEGATIWFTGARSGAPERLDRCHVGADHVWYIGAVGTDPP